MGVLLFPLKPNLETRVSGKIQSKHAHALRPEGLLRVLHLSALRDALVPSVLGSLAAVGPMLLPGVCLLIGDL